MIKVFWYAFLVGIAGVTLRVYLFDVPAPVLSFVLPLGIVCLLVGWAWFPAHFGRKLWDRCNKEPESWNLVSCIAHDKREEGQGAAQ